MSKEPAAPTMARLIALLEAGYQIDYGVMQHVRDALWLRHPARKRTAQTFVMLYDNGLVVGRAAGSDDPPRFEPDEGDAFGRYLSGIPKPTWWERNNSPFYVAGAWILIAATAWILTEVAEAIWEQLRHIAA